MAESTIDKVQIEIEATAKGTSAVFAQLESQLATLQKALGGIDTSKLQKAKDASKAINPNVNTNGVSKAERDIKNSVSKIQQSLAGITPYMNAALNGDSSSLTSFNRRVISIQSSLETTKQKLEQISAVNKMPTEGFAKLEEESQKVSARLDELRQKIADAVSGKAPVSSSGLKQLTDEATQAEQRLMSLNAQQQEMEANGTAYTDPFASYKDSIAQAEEQLSTFKSNVDEATAPRKADTSAFDVIKEKAMSVKDALKNLGHQMLDGFKNIGKFAKSASSAMGKLKDKLSGGFNKGFKSVLKYAFGIRSLYVLFRRLRKAVVESFSDLQNSGAFFQTTKANVEGLKTALATLKFQFGAAFEPIFNAVAPALQSFINYLIKVANTISAFTAKLTGKSVYSKVEKVTFAAKSNLGGAAKNAKELNKQLQGFDELNNLTTNQGSSGSTGGSSSDNQDHATYKSASVDDALGDFTKKLADLIKEGDWKGVGQTISDKLSETMESIPWDKIYEKARGFGKGLADFLNGLINPRLFGNLGKTLAGGLNTAFAFLLSFAKTFDWANLGVSIGEGINNFFQNFDFFQAAQTLSTFAIGLLSTISNAIDEIDWDVVGQKIVEFIGGIDWVELFGSLTHLGLSIAGALLELLLGAAEELTRNLSDFFSEIGMDSIAGFFEGAADNIRTSIDWLKEKFQTIIDAVKEFFGIHSPSTVFAELGGYLIDGLFEGISDAISGVKEWIQTNVIDKIMSAFDTGKDIAIDISTKLSGVFTKVKDLTNFSEKWESFKEGFKDVKSKIESKVGGALSKITDLDTWKEKYESLKTAWVDKASTIKSKVGDQLKNITDLDTWKSKYEGLKSVWVDKASSMKATVSGAISRITDLDTWKTKMSNLRSTWADKAATMKATVSGALSKIGDLDTWKSKMNNLKNSWVGKSASFAVQTAGKSIDSLKSKIASLKESWKGKTVSFGLKFSAAASDLRTWVNNNVLSKIRSVFSNVPILSNFTNRLYLAQGAVLNKATQFVGGEAGSEAVIPLERNLGGIKKIADVMLDGLQDASRFRYSANPMAFSGTISNSTSNTAMRSSNDNNYLVAEQNRLLQEQNRLLQQIANKNVSISSHDLFNATQNEANNYYNRTGNSPFLF